MRITYAKLLKQEDWDKWQQLEYHQLDQYEAQGICDTSKQVEAKEAIFNLVWTNYVKVGGVWKNHVALVKDQLEVARQGTKTHIC